VVLLLRKETAFYVTKLIGLSITLLGITAFFHWFFPAEKMAKEAAAGSGAAMSVTQWLTWLQISSNAGGLVVICFILMGFIVAFNFSIIHFLERLFSRRTSAGRGRD